MDNKPQGKTPNFDNAAVSTTSGVVQPIVPGNYPKAEDIALAKSMSSELKTGCK